jgi:catechol 2,3-dioxygenase-like lactoylglutathione lyase family enzyme
MSLIKRLHHSSLLVSDLAAARAFYEGILDLQPSDIRPPMAFDGIWYEIGEQQIHLLALPSPEAGLERPKHGGRDRHTALIVHDFAELVARLEKTATPFTYSQSGRRALFCRDPDGNALEFIEESPSAAAHPIQEK